MSHYRADPNNQPVCPMCQQRGVHGNVDLCLAALREAVRLHRIRQGLPPEEEGKGRAQRGRNAVVGPAAEGTK